MDVNVPGSAVVQILTRPAYPSHLVAQHRLPDGTPVLVRPIAADDSERHLRFLRSLSLQTRYQRLLSARRLLPGELQRLVAVDYHTELALVATVASPTGEEEAGVARFVRQGAGGESGQDNASDNDVADGEADPETWAEFAIVIHDDWQHRGLGRLLLCSLLAAARADGIARLAGTTLATNTSMLRLARRLGFSVSPVPGDWTLKRIRSPAPQAAMPGCGRVQSAVPGQRSTSGNS